MKCPLFAMFQPFASRKQGISDYDCFKEECAWWQVGDEQCAILNLTEGIADIAHWLGNMLEKMPRARQFRK